jgi:oligoendopeptidase F
MTLEELAKKHLHVDLSKESFWQGAYDIIAQDVETFCQESR